MKPLHVRTAATFVVAAGLAAIISLAACRSKTPAGPVAPDPERLTLADGSKVFVSPPRNEADGWFPAKPSALWARPKGGGEPRRLTFGSASVADPTVLDDGRVLFVSAMPQAAGAKDRLALFAVNNDGTGVLPYACQHDGAPVVRRPREVGEDRVAFAAADSPGAAERWEFVLSARPFRSRAVVPAAQVPEVETMSARPRRPMGRLSTVDPAKKTGILVCLDARRNGESDKPLPVARVRILSGAPGEAGGTRSLGEMPVAADGSFLVEVPADVPLGVESLAADGRVLKTLPPWFWVRPGESRGCIGCHEPHGMAPRNQRPLASKAAPVKLKAGGTS